MYQKYLLENGLTLIVCKMPHLRSVAVSYFVRAGGCYESVEQTGISHFIEHLCFKGTEKRPTAKDISEAIEATGGIINGGTDKELTVYWCRVASKHLALAVDVLIDILRNSRFLLEDIELERNVIIEEINMNWDNPQQRVDALIYELLWPEQPIGRDVGGLKETVQRLDKATIIDFYLDHYLPNNIVVSIAGDVEYDKASTLIESSTNNWRSREIGKRMDNITYQAKPKIKVEYREIEQIYLCLGLHGLSINHPDRFAADILNVILGEGMSSRLFTEIREKCGLVYEIGSSTDHFVDTGDIIIHSCTEPKNIDRALYMILEQLFLLKSTISENELGRAKELIKGRLSLALESTPSVSNWYGVQELLIGKMMDLEEVSTLVDNVTMQDVCRVAADLISKDKLNSAFVGPVQDSDRLYKLLCM